MSEGPRMSLQQALDTAAWLVRALGLTTADEAEQTARAGVSLVGSARRRRWQVGDLEFISPLPLAGTGNHDPLYQVLASRFEGAAAPPKAKAALFEPDPPAVELVNPIGRAVLGLKPGFKLARVVLRGRSREVTVEFNRYDAGPSGNRGWTELRCTGPATFGKAILTRHKRVQCIPVGTEGSDSYLLGANGTPIPTPTEQSVFDLVGLKFIKPEDRTDHTAANILDSLGALHQHQQGSGR